MNGDPFFMARPGSGRKRPAGTPARTPRGGGKRASTTGRPTPRSAATPGSRGGRPGSARRGGDDDELDSSSGGGARRRRRIGDGGFASSDDDGASSSDSLGDDDDGARGMPRETPDEKRVRLAREFLDNIERAERRKGRAGSDSSGSGAGGGGGASDDDGNDDDDDDDSDEDGERAAMTAAEVGERVARRLREDAMDRAGHLVRERAAAVGALGARLADVSRYTRFNGHALSLTCLALASDDRTAFTGGKDCRIVQHDLETGARVTFPGGRRQVLRRPYTLHARRLKLDPHGEVSPGHTAHVLSLAASDDGRLLASGGADNIIRVWDLRAGGTEDGKPVAEAFRGHRGHVTGLAFRRGTTTLYSASHDKTVRVWDCAEMGYVETLFGHDGPALCLAAGARERCVTGGADGTARIWKVPEETHLVLRTGYSACQVDAVDYVTESTYVTGAADGTVALWTAAKKKPVAKSFHGARGAPVASVASLRFSDLIASGAGDGHVRFHAASERTHKLTEVNTASIAGFVNGLAVASEARFALAAAGQEPRAGRWERRKGARNAMYLIPLQNGEPDESSADDDDDGSGSSGI
jgi:ribosomal RNA-processing protein 9